jgi:hypothetical protein
VYRRFLRVLEDDRLKIDGFDLIYGNITCSGCRMGIMSSFIRHEGGQSDDVPSGDHPLTGDPDIPEYVAKR